MKKILSFVLALCLMCGMTTFAEASNNATIVTAVVDEAYIIEIPATSTLCSARRTPTLPSR